MNKNVIIIFTLFIIIIVICYTWLNGNRNNYKLVKTKNYEYEQYKNCEIYGPEVITLINKAINENEKNNVTKDEKGFYINNNENSIIIEIIMITNEESKETTTYRMEAINKVGISDFIYNFNTAKFYINNIEYHKNSRISKIVIKQLINT